MMCNVALERRMGFLNNNMNTECGKIMTALKGYQTASSQAMYGLPWWKYLPGRFSGVFTRLVEHKDTLFNTIGQLVDESLSENESIVDESILGQLLNNHRLPIKEVKVSCVDYITGMYSLWKLNNFYVKSEWQENVHSVIVPLVFGTRKGDIFGFSNLKHTTSRFFPSFMLHY